MKRMVLATLMLCFLLTGCASAPPLNFSVPDVGPVASKLDAELRSTTVTWGRPDEQVGEIPPVVTTDVTQTWETALVESLNRTAVFTDSSENTVSLSVKILELDIPAIGLAMETKSTARYELIDRHDGSIIFTQDIQSLGHVPLDYAFLGPVRARESINRSVQNSIKLFLQSIKDVDIEKPMFPSRTES